ncbi:MAG: response regulator transcription factor [Pirellulaceae bacterium]
MNETPAVIHLIDDDDSLRVALGRLLTAAGFEVASYSSAGEFLMHPLPAAPGCLVLDVRMPGPSGLELQAALTRQGSRLPIIFLTGHGDIPMSVRAIKAGAIDFLTKPVERQALLEAIGQALQTQRLNDSSQQRIDQIRSRFESLTERERAIFSLVIQGKLNKQIAVALGIAERTVKAHRAQVMEKMEVETLADLVRVGSLLEPMATAVTGAS